MASIKFAFKDEIRRVLLREDGGNLTFSKLIETVLTLFPSLTGKSFHLYWQDDESDLITLQSNAELDEAINVMQSFGTTYTLKFLIKLDEESRPAPAVGKDPRGVGVVHQGITCDECNVSPICGIRYKCTVRKDFDLCETCEAKKLQPHAMIKITDPSQAPEILIFGVRDQPPAHPPVGRGNYHHPHNPHHPPHHPAGCGRERHWQRGQRLGGEGENPHPSCGRGRHWGGPRCGRWGEKIAELVKDPVVAPFVAAMDEFISSATASATNNNSDSNPPPQETFNNKPTEVNQLEQEMIEKAILESLVINESKPTAPVEEKPKPALVQEKKPAVVHLDTARPAVPTLPKPALRFVRDNTIPDGTVLQPGAVFRKAWRVRNDGAHPWPEGAVLVSVGGDIMSDQDHKEPLPVLAPEQDGEIAIQLTAPEKAGMYTAYYRAQTKEQQYFGQRLWASIVVADHENDWTVVSEKTPAVSPLPPAPTSLPEPPVIPVAPAVPSAPAITANVATPSVPAASEERKEDEASIVRETTFVETVQVPPPSEAAQPAAHLRSAILLWRRELAILSEMGFSDAETILPLLQQHLGTPLSLSADKNAAPKMEGMQQIVATLLQLN